jgi:hypothetical protein
VRRLARVLRWFTGYAGVGISVSVVYLVFVLRYFVLGNPEIVYLTPNEIGDFLAGILGPLATFWLILGFFQQGHELRNSTNALRQQSLEFAKTVRQQQEQITYDLAFRRYQIEQVDRITAPILELEALGRAPAGEGVSVRLVVRNFGASVVNPTLHRRRSLVQKLPTLSFGQEHRFEAVLGEGARERVTLSFLRVDGTSGRQDWLVSLDGAAVAIERA